MPVFQEEPVRLDGPAAAEQHEQAGGGGQNHAGRDPQCGVQVCHIRWDLQCLKLDRNQTEIDRYGIKISF